MLRSLLSDMAIEFSIWQGDLAASVFFIIYVEPFLVCLEALLRALFVVVIKEAFLGNMDDEYLLSQEEKGERYNSG
jgi:hypothetical protein